MDKGTDHNMWLIFYTQYNLSYLMFVPNFKILGQVVLEKSLTIISICITLERWKKEKKKKKAKLNFSTLVLITVIHLVVLIVYTKFEDCSTQRC